jgi:hypothetical protein
MGILILTPELEAQVPEHLRLMRGRMGCPFHGSTKSRSLKVFDDGGFYCHKCQASGVTQENHTQWLTNNPLKKTRPAIKPIPLPKKRDTQKDNPPLGDAQARAYESWQAKLAFGGEPYLRSRRIPLHLAKAYGLGYKPPKEPFFITEGNHGVGNDERIVVPHTTPEGTVVSLYSRATSAENDFKHIHLRGNKGIFNAPAFNLMGEPLFVCEGAFDALSLLALGFKRVIAVFGLSGFRWDWVQPQEQEIVLALDYDSTETAKESGRKAISDFLTQATFHNVVVSRVTAKEMGHKKDINEAWVAGALDLHPASPPPTLLPDYLQLPPDPPAKWLDNKAWLNYRDLVRTYAPLQRQSGYTEAQLFSLPTTAHSADAGVLWNASCFGHTELEFLPDKVLMRGGSGEHSAHRAYLRVSGWVTWLPQTNI